MLNIEITKWTPKEQKQKIIKDVSEINKPIKYIYLGGFDKNGVWIYETKTITLNELKKLLSYFESYFIIENEKDVEVKRVN